MDYSISFEVESPSTDLKRVRFYADPSTEVVDIIESFVSKIGHRAEFVNLTYKGQTLFRARTLGSYGIPDGAVIYCIRSTRPK